MPSARPAPTIVPASAARCRDLAVLFGTRGAAALCQCQRYKLRPREAFRTFPVEERRRRLREQTRCGDPAAARTSGLVGFIDGEPAGWCAVEPRPAYAGLARHARVPWEGREEDRTDPAVWAVTCVFVRPGFRRRGVAGALVTAAVGFAGERGARALEAYPIVTTDVIAEELHVGTEAMFAAAGLAIVTRPTPRRVVMRIAFDAA
jgi:GNAT superfamily N-acetyltransferase